MPYKSTMLSPRQISRLCNEMGISMRVQASNPVDHESMASEDGRAAAEL